MKCHLDSLYYEFRSSLGAVCSLHSLLGYRRGFYIAICMALVTVIGACQKSPNKLPAAPEKQVTPIEKASPQESSGEPEHKRAKERREHLNKTVWARELEAQRYEAVLVRLWDDLLAERKKESPDKYSILKQVEFDSLIMLTSKGVTHYSHGIEGIQFGSPKRSLDWPAWKTWLDLMKARGFRIVQTEWHHAGFQPPSDTKPAESKVAMSAHIENSMLKARVIIRGDLRVVWSTKRDSRGLPRATSIDATGIEILTRRGDVPFELMYKVEPPGKGEPPGIHPIIAHDMNRDGLPELLLGGCNRIYWNLGDGKFRRDQLTSNPHRIFDPGLIADFDGNGRPDFVGVSRQSHDFVFFEGGTNGRLISEKPPKPDRGFLHMPQTMTAGDIDNDGDLDLFVGQYQMISPFGRPPQPYYDGNDGTPAFLMLNEGDGRLTDVTQARGLSKKRLRRSYGSAFVHLDSDDALDLVVISDYAGVDLYRNNGTGHFTDVTTKIVDEWHNFGMSVTFGDYDVDGRTDFYVSGMASNTARRLEGLGAVRPDQPKANEMRRIMGYGSRMYLARGKRFEEPSFKDQVARTGWTWGSTTLDFDNDGDDDIYVANGHQSGTKSTRDHCWQFWCHEIYEKETPYSKAEDAVLEEAYEGYLDGTESWDGYQKNRLLMNRSGKGFLNIAFLMGVAVEEDARGVLSADFDGDGRLEIVTEVGTGRTPPSLYIFRNRLQTNNNWIGINLWEEGQGFSPLGARVRVSAGGRVRVRQIVSGDSLTSQHPPTAHFGLGANDAVDWLEVRWSNGTVRRIQSPEINRYHTVHPKRSAQRTKTSGKPSSPRPRK